MTRIFSVLELSTAHVTEAVARALDALVTAPPPLGALFDAETDWQYWIIAERWSEYGWWVWAGQEDSIDLVPPDLKACFDHARAKDCDWIRFDRDEEPSADLPLHDW